MDDKTMEDVLNRQIEACLPLIEMERAAFIKKDHGRLQALIGVEYWERKTGETKYFHQYIEEGTEYDVIPDPYDIPLEELALLPRLEKKVERIGTYSFLPLFQMQTRDRERLELAAKVWHKLTHRIVCAEREIEEVTGGHEAYMEWKLEEAVKVIR